MSNYPPKPQNGNQNPDYIRPSMRRQSSVGRGGLSLSPEEKNLVSNNALGKYSLNTLSSSSFYYCLYYYIIIVIMIIVIILLLLLLLLLLLFSYYYYEFQ